MYTTTWCGYCVRLKRTLDRAGIAYREVDVEADHEAAALVEYVNGGYRTVPTLVFPDGEWLTNPSLAEVQAELERLASATTASSTTMPGPSTSAAPPGAGPAADR
jgi:mycoredoxin